MKKVFEIGVNLGYWLFFNALIWILYISTQVNGINGPNFEKLLVLIFGFILFPSIISFYGAYIFLFQLYIRKAETVNLLLYLIFFLLLSSLGALINIYTLVDVPIVFIEVGIVSFFLNSFNILMGFILHSFISWFTDLKEKEELSKKTQSLELEMIKLKLDPHFLFNTINNIDVLIETDSEKASEYIQKLSSILRFYLYKSSNTTIRLNEEIHYIQEYIELQKIRTSNLEYVHLTIQGDATEKEIPPMLLIPFIENAFKHSSNKKTDRINIHIIIQDNILNFTCSNTIDTKQKHHCGIGNQLIKDRLNLLYGNHYDLNFTISENNYLISLSLPL